MTLNDNQKLVILIGTVAVFAMGIYPPWEWLGQLGTSTGGYGFIFVPPAPEGPGDRIDLGRLLVQLGVAVLVTIGLVLSLQTRAASENDH